MSARSLAIPVVLFLFWNLMNYVPPEAGSGICGYIMSLPIMGKILFGTFLLSRSGDPDLVVSQGHRAEFQMMVAAMVLIVFNVVFWTLFEQAGSSLTLFADRNTVLEIGWTAPLFAMFRATPITYYLFCGGAGRRRLLAGLVVLRMGRGRPATRRTMGIGLGRRGQRRS